MITISLCMIVRDEEAVLARCLDSVRDAVDEIIIVDTGSQDNTRQIAERYTQRVYSFQWIDDFSAARNYAYDQASMSHQMWLDADDVLSPENLSKLLVLKETLDPGIDIVTMQYNTHFDSSGNVILTSCRERLTRRDANLRWMDPVHECIPLSGKILHSDIAIDHRKIKEEDTSQRNLRIYENLVQSEVPLTPRQTYYYARELRDHGENHKAAYYFELFLESGKGWSEDNIAACFALSACYRGLRNDARALWALLQSFTFGGPRAEILCEIAYHYKRLNQRQEALQWFLAATHLQQPEFLVFKHQHYWGYIPHIEASVLYYELGDLPEAIRHNDLAAHHKPGDPSIESNARFYARVAEGAGGAPPHTPPGK